MEQHVNKAKPHLILGGRRLKLNENMTKMFLEKSISPSNINRYLIHNIASLYKKGILFSEEGFYINPKGLLGFIPYLRHLKCLTGCNMSFYKNAILDINGFDEDYRRPAIGEDIDITWRFLRAGYRLFSVRNLAVQYHLYHKDNWTNQDLNFLMMQGKKEKDLYRCINGIEKLV
jgi:GT2 family glycosyltransferase